MSHLHYHFGPFRLDPYNKCVTNQGRRVRITPKAFDILVMMLENSGRLVSRSELHERLWPDTYVSDHNISVYVSAIRKVLGEARSRRVYIRTVPKSGYRFIGEVFDCYEPCRVSLTDRNGFPEDIAPTGRASKWPMFWLLTAVIWIVVMGS